MLRTLQAVLQQGTSEAVMVLPAPMPLWLLDMEMHAAACFALLDQPARPALQRLLSWRL